MLFIPEADPCVRIMGFDPGGKLGMAVLEVNLITERVCVKMAGTLSSDKAPTRYPVVFEYHGAPIARHHFVKDELRCIFDQYRPHVVASEAPFMGRLPQVFKSLVLLVYNIRLALFDYDTHKPLILLDPPSVKKSVGAKGRSDKDVMKEAVMKLDIESDVVLSELDEHGIDAIAVAYSQVPSILRAYMAGRL